MQHQHFHISSLHLSDSLMMAFCFVHFNFSLLLPPRWRFMRINLQSWEYLRCPQHLDTYRCCPIEAGSLAGRSGLHGSSALWVTQLAWSPPGLHFRNLYTAVCGAPEDRSKAQMFYCSQRFMQLFRSTRLFRVKISKSVYFSTGNVYIFHVWSISRALNIIMQQVEVMVGLMSHTVV